MTLFKILLEWEIVEASAHEQQVITSARKHRSRTDLCLFSYKMSDGESLTQHLSTWLAKPAKVLQEPKEAKDAVLDLNSNYYLPHFILPRNVKKETPSGTKEDTKPSGKGGRGGGTGDGKNRDKPKPGQDKQSKKKGKKVKVPLLRLTATGKTREGWKELMDLLKANPPEADGRHFCFQSITDTKECNFAEQKKCNRHHAEIEEKTAENLWVWTKELLRPLWDFIHQPSVAELVKPTQAFKDYYNNL